MPKVPAETLVRHLCACAAADARGELSDEELVDCFAAGRDERAFEALVRRHGPMVLRVCRRVLGDVHDAEDAFQATFLVLARRAHALRQRASVGGWLYGVAYRVALRARSDAARRRALEPRAAAPAAADPLTELTVREAQAAFDEELVRLPERLRAPLVLCCLEGLTRDEAARQLGCPPSTLKGRLEQARGLLRSRLVRRGLTLSAGLLASLLAEGVARAGLSAPMFLPVVQAALLYTAGSAASTGAGSAAVSLANGFVRAGATGRWKVAAGLVLLLSVAGGGATLVARRDPGGTPAELAAVPVPRAREESPALDPEAAAQADWPQWRGPNRDGVVHGVTVPKHWPKALKEEWRVPVGEGYSSPVVADGHVIVFTRQKDDEVVLCLDVVSGKEVWRSEPCPAPYVPGPAARGNNKPRSTPAIAGGRVFTFGVGGILSCLDAGTGKLLWRKDSKQYPVYGAAASPLVENGLCIVHAGGPGKGGLTAFDAATGDVKWCNTDSIGPSYASPILADLVGERQVLTFTQGNFLSVSAATGKRLWGLSLPRFDVEKCLTPVRYKDLIVVADYQEPLRAIRPERGEKGIVPKEVWKASGPPMHMSSPVLAGDWLFGFSGQKGGHLFCLDARTGRTLWQSEGRLGGSATSYASLLNAGSVWLALTNNGWLIVLRASGTAYEPITEYQVAEGGTDAHPVFLGDRILIKDDLTLRSFRIERDGND
jgi:RNA polymerase sigma factor (sigma-70 family)